MQKIHFNARIAKQLCEHSHIVLAHAHMDHNADYQIATPDLPTKSISTTIR